MPKFCHKCGMQIAEDQKFCAGCGTPVAPEMPAAVAQPPQQPVQQAALQSIPQPIQQPVQQAALQSIPQPIQQPVQQVAPQPIPQPVQQPVPPPVQQYQQPQQFAQPPMQQFGQPPMMTQQLAQQAYMNAQYQNMAAINMKPQRYVPLRVLLILACAVLLFIGWRYGIDNIKLASMEPSAFEPEETETDEDLQELQSEYNDIYNAPRSDPFEMITHPFYEWLYSEDIETNEGGERQ